MECMEVSNPKMHEFFSGNDAPMLEIALASPLMTLFSNILPLSESTHIITMFILDGESFLTGLFMNLFKKMEEEIMSLKDDHFELSSYLSKTIYLDALQKGKFYE